jgi:hypothetical protein
MRIPFDLIAAFLGLEAVRVELVGRMTYQQALALDRERTGLGEAVLALIFFFLIVWLMNEVLVRHLEWRTRWGRYPGGWRGLDGQARGPHPRVVLARWSILLQALSVVLYVLFLWHYGWPIKTSQWPHWVGLDRDRKSVV